jgi:hypothetical protein
MNCTHLLGRQYFHIALQLAHHDPPQVEFGAADKTCAMSMTLARAGLRVSAANPSANVPFEGRFNLPIERLGNARQLFFRYVVAANALSYGNRL